MINNFAKLVESSIKIKDFIEVRTIFGEEKLISTIGNSARKGCFCINNGIIAFLVEGTTCVIPYSENIESILDRHGFKETFDLFVPFSNGEIPAEENVAHYWAMLKALRDEGNL